jgi:hypothetical protein
MVPIMDAFNQIKGGKILIGDESITFLSGNDDYKAFREDFTESWIKVNRTGAEISWVQVEVELSPLTVEYVHALSDHQIWKILSNKLCFLKNTVPNELEALKGFQKNE